jgi:tetratricopeptide (TPR) repeat protein
MDIQEVLDQIHAAGGDPQKLLLTTLDVALSVHGQDLRAVIEAAAIPHWYTPEILAQMLGVDQALAEEYVRRLRQLSMVESFEARGGWNVHEATRLALRRDLYSNQAERFRELSSAASKCFAGDSSHEQIEALYHCLTSEPVKGGGQLKKLESEWFDAGRFETRQALAEALDELLKFTPPAVSARIRCLIYLARIRQDYRDVDETERLLRDALAMLEDNRDDEAEIACHDYLGDTLEKKGRISAALAEYLKAREIRKRAAGNAPENPEWIRSVAYSHARVGRMYRALLLFEKAEAEHEEGLSAALRLTEMFPNDTTWRRLLAFFYGERGRTYEEQGKDDLATDSCQASLRVFEELTHLDYNNREWQRDLAITHGQVGRIGLKRGNGQAAFSEFQAAFEIEQRLVLQFPDNNNLQRDLCITNNDLGGIHEGREEFQQALAHYRAALEIALRVTQRVPGNPEWQRDLAISHSNIGRIHMREGRLAEALAEHEMSLGIYRHLARGDPGNAQRQRDLCSAHSEVGRIHELQRQFENAFAEYTEAFTLAERLVSGDPGSTASQHALALALINLAIIHTATDRRDSARDGFGRAAAILRELTELDPARKDWNNDYRYALQQLRLLENQDKPE